jgi:hypothetical protein
MENRNGTLYWLDDDGSWYYKGPAPYDPKNPGQVTVAPAAPYTIEDQLDDIQTDIEDLQSQLDDLQK